MSSAPDVLAGSAVGQRPRTLSGRIVRGLNRLHRLEVHAKAAKAAGATREEVVEASLLAAALRAGAAATHGLMALKLFDQAAAPAGV